MAVKPNSEVFKSSMSLLRKGSEFGAERPVPSVYFCFYETFTIPLLGVDSTLKSQGVKIFSTNLFISILLPVMMYNGTIPSFTLIITSLNSFDLTSSCFHPCKSIVFILILIISQLSFIRMIIKRWFCNNFILFHVFNVQ